MVRPWESIFEEDEEELDILIRLLIDTIRDGATRTRRPQHTRPFTGHQLVENMLDGHMERSHNIFRMEPHVFRGLATLLESRGLLRNGRTVSVLEQLAIFMTVVAHASANRVACEQFQHSSETVSRYFHAVLRAMCILSEEMIKLPTGDEPAHILVRNTPFKDCLGAIDGTHVPVIVPREIQERYRNRHGTLSQNVMAVVSFDMQFRYICAGWEGSAADMRIMQHCLENGSFSVPEGKYYLVDSGYANTQSLLAPYRGERYHLGQFSRGQTRYHNQKEKFNHAHASFRNIVERAFGVLKRRFKILRVPSPFSVETQRDIVVACAVIHNYICKYANSDEELQQDEDDYVEEENMGVDWQQDDTGSAHDMGQFLRENISRALWRL
ncbi:hypothetical protein J5N97_013826 [Dioscorea zingiberensis]|uniref:DDE Tnp4 domain-containing protein n=1 Tax=Dioscorea zingiberensis TaxID=325984 RepID=A0A9D5CSU1_9LILI|nr:hypothetical protein J5N97_013826 [Dioscorea zingiberensis]